MNNFVPRGKDLKSVGVDIDLSAIHKNIISLLNLT